VQIRGGPEGGKKKRREKGKRECLHHELFHRSQGEEGEDQCFRNLIIAFRIGQRRKKKREKGKNSEKRGKERGEKKGRPHFFSRTPSTKGGGKKEKEGESEEVRTVFSFAAVGVKRGGKNQEARLEKKGEGRKKV